MTPFEKNLTDSIDNLNSLISRVKNTGEKFDTVYTSEENIDSMLENNVDTKSGSNVTINHTVAGGKFDWEIQGKCEQDGTPTPENPIDIKVVTGDNEVVIQNKNLFDGILELGSYDNTTGKKFEVENHYRNKNIIPIFSDSNYTISINGTAHRYIIYEYDKNKNYLGYKETTGTFTTSNNCRYINFICYNSDFVWDFVYLKVQIELGSTATSYVPHAEQKVTLHLGTNYLAGIGDYNDKIVGKTDDWKIVRKVGKIVYNGTENFYEGTTSQTGVKRIGSVPKTLPFNVIIANQLCNYGIYYNGTINYGQFGNFVYDKLNGFYVCVSNNETAESFKSKLQSNNAIIYVCIDTTEETITDTTLITDLNDMYDLLGYDGQTNINIIPDTGNAQGTLKVTAFVTEKEV